MAHWQQQLSCSFMTYTLYQGVVARPRLAELGQVGSVETIPGSSASANPQPLQLDFNHLV